MVGARMPDVPDPTKIAQSGVEVVKAIAQGGVGVGIDIVAGVEQILFNTIEGSITALSSGAKEIVRMAQANVSTGKATAEKIRADVDRAASTVLTQVDSAIGGEVVRKFKSEIERQLR